MKPPWLVQSQESAELEALQTDVMRFVAILGLCLAAIFSLVHSAAVEQGSQGETRAVEAPSVAAESVTSPKVLAPQPQVTAEIATPAAPPATQNPPEPGFTLEFSSAEALDTLLRQEKVALYLRLENSFLRLGPQGHFHPTDSPGNYYVMATQTVPEKYVAAMATQGIDEQGSWGVTLPTAISAQISQHMHSERSGSLVIDDSGRVSLYSSTAP